MKYTAAKLVLHQWDTLFIRSIVNMYILPISLEIKIVDTNTGGKTHKFHRIIPKTFTPPVAENPPKTSSIVLFGAAQSKSKDEDRKKKASVWKFTVLK